MQPSKVSHDISEPTTESIDAAKQAQVRERAASGANLNEEGRIKLNHSRHLLSPRVQWTR